MSKRCTKCNQIKPLSEFSRSSRAKDGLQSKCKSCDKVYKKLNKKNISEYKKKWREVNADHIRDYSKSWYADNGHKYNLSKITTPYVYKIVNKITKDVYVGSSARVERWALHRCAATYETGKVYDYPLYSQIRQFGIDNFEFIKLIICETREEAYKIEKFLISKYGTLNIRKGKGV